MKKFYVLPSLLVSAILSLVTTTAVAYPVNNEGDFTCPDISVVANFGDYIAGFGTEAMLSQLNHIYFQTTQWPAGVPNSVTGYANSGTGYDSVTARVTCSYASADPAHLPFDLSYYVTNGRGGLVVAQTNNSINVVFPVGLHS